MKKNNTVFRKKRRGGMTILEVVIFLTLSALMFVSTFAVVSRFLYSDRALEERVAAFYTCQSEIERLHTIDFDDLTVGFVEKEDEPGHFTLNKGKVDFYYLKDGEPVQGTLRLDLKLNDLSGDISYYNCFTKLNWTDPMGRSRDIRVYFVLYP